MPTIPSQLCAAFLVVTAVCLTPSSSLAQRANDWTYQIGGRSTFMATTMHLSRLGGGFRDLPPGGKRLAHSSSLFFVMPRGPHLRLGVETLVGNTYGDSDTGIMYQAAGIIAEYQTRGVWFIAFGAQGGAMIANATQPRNADDASQVRDGSYYKGNGLFVAPSLGVGRTSARVEFRVLLKPVLHIPGSAGLYAFNSTYLGVSLGFKRR